MSYELSGSFNLERNGRPIEEAFRDGNGLPVDGLEAYFPIIRMSETDRWNPIGTGFFISNNGLFATAKHVLVDETTGLLIPSLAGVQLIRRDNHVIIREIIKVVVHPEFDVAVGFLFDKKFHEPGIQTVNKCFSLTISTPSAGEKVATFAFPRPLASGDSNTFQLRFTSVGIAGQIEEFYPHGRDRVMLRGPCFRTTMSTAGGASGAPVAYGQGHVFGVISSGVPDQPINYVSSITPILDLQLPNLKLLNGEIRESMSIRELASIGLVRVEEIETSA
jgi:hypothetical protein